MATVTSTSNNETKPNFLTNGFNAFTKPTDIDLSRALEKAEDFENFYPVFYMLKKNFHETKGPQQAVKNEATLAEIDRVLSLPVHKEVLEALWKVYDHSNKHTVVRRSVVGQIRAQLSKMIVEIQNPLV